MHPIVQPHSQHAHKQQAHVPTFPCHVVLPATACLVLQGFQSVYKPKRSGTVSFAELLDAVASVDPEMRIRFTSPHPKEFSDEVLQVSPRPGPIGDALHCCQASAAQTERLKADFSLQTTLHMSTSSSHHQLASLGISIIDQVVLGSIRSLRLTISQPLLCSCLVFCCWVSIL